MDSWEDPKETRWLVASNTFDTVKRLLARENYIWSGDKGRESHDRDMLVHTWKVDAELPSGYPLTLQFELVFEDGYDPEMKSAQVSYISESGKTLTDRVPTNGDMAKNLFSVAHKHLQKMDDTWKFASDSGLRNKLIKLAHDKPELRKHLLPIITSEKVAMGDLGSTQVTSTTVMVHADMDKGSWDEGSRSYEEEREVMRHRGRVDVRKALELAGDALFKEGIPVGSIKWTASKLGSKALLVRGIHRDYEYSERIDITLELATPSAGELASLRDFKDFLLGRG